VADSSSTKNRRRKTNQTSAHRARTSATTRTAAIHLVRSVFVVVVSNLSNIPSVKHICHLNELTDEQLNKLLNNIIDMENLYISISRQNDADIKKVSDWRISRRFSSIFRSIQQVYIYLSKLLRHCILTKSQSTVTVQGPVGDPPFEVPDIQKIVSNFVFLKVRLGRGWRLTGVCWRIFQKFP
jgi:hypothetical protein